MQYGGTSDLSPFFRASVLDRVFYLGAWHYLFNEAAKKQW